NGFLHRTSRRLKGIRTAIGEAEIAGLGFEMPHSLFALLPLPKRVWEPILAANLKSVHEINNDSRCLDFADRQIRPLLSPQCHKGRSPPIRPLVYRLVHNGSPK